MASDDAPTPQRLMWRDRYVDELDRNELLHVVRTLHDMLEAERQWAIVDSQMQEMFNAVSRRRAD